MAAPGANLTIDGTRLWDSLMEMAKIGPGIAGGNNRQTVTINGATTINDPSQTPAQQTFDCMQVSVELFGYPTNFAVRCHWQKFTRSFLRVLVNLPDELINRPGDFTAHDITGQPCRKEQEEGRAIGDHPCDQDRAEYLFQVG